MAHKTIESPVQLSLFPCQGTGVKDTANGSTSAAKFQNYIHTREALFRLLASYPPTMPLIEALQLARVDFTKGSTRALPACHQGDARKEVAL